MSWVGVQLETDELDETMAREIAQVGIMPFLKAEVGQVFNLAGQPCKIIGKVTRSEFMDALTQAGFDAMRINAFTSVPVDFSFYRISVD